MTARTTASRRLIGLIAVAAAVFTSTGCVAIPDSSAPQPIEAFDRKLPVNAVPEPRRSDDPETLVRNYVKAMADPSGGHSAARKFLTDDASKRWDDQGEMRIVDNVSVIVDERTEAAVRLRITADQVGRLSPEGQLLPASGALVTPLTLRRVRGSWRINGDQLHGTITDREQFLTAYRQADLYFPDPSMSRLVTDPRWVFGATPQATELLARLLQGPSPDLSGAIGSGAEKGVSLSGPVSGDNGQLSIDLNNMVDGDAANRTVLAAQIIWTLDEAGITGPYTINADGAPLVANHDHGWRTADVQSFQPDPQEAAAVPLHLVSDGKLLRTAGGRAVPVPGPLGDGRSVRNAAVTRDLSRAAVVEERDGKQVLLEGPYGAAPTEVTSGRVINSPTYVADSSDGYAVVDGHPVEWSVDGQGSVRSLELDISAVREKAPGPITAMSVAPDGVRVALVVSGRPMLAVVSTNERGLPSLTGVRPAAIDIDTAVQDIAWSTGSTLYAVRLGDETPVMRIPLAGGESSGLVGGNLKPPVTRVSASPATVYVTDTQGVQQLGVGPGRTDQYWTSVSPDTRSSTIPVIPGG
ncbi:LpqB family beta-propeller domain-containing protein [Gordonia zhaorongruii]|uniref:LpqB family beta-propeller domain-containing protein n=1 Tax=Gordonia zhaorongruii TaxID=2597659 RepID=UPI00104A9992|nr:LpqB family beta-propeller domain-containing protein [Gordonia zhaorongruii]